MAKKISPPEHLQESAKKYFQVFPTINHIFVTDDGMFFIPSKKQEAEQHANTIKSSLYKIEKSLRKPRQKNTKTTNTKK